MTIELWQNLSDYPGYAVSSLGRIKSLARVVPKGQSAMKIRERIRATHVNTAGYPIVRMKRVDGLIRTVVIHRLLAKAFIPNFDKKPQVNHKNGVRTENTIHNLEWCTVTENVRHSYRPDGIRSSSKETYHNNSKLTKTDAIDIALRLASGFSKEAIQKEFGISRSTVSKISRRKAWIKTTSGISWEHQDERFKHSASARCAELMER